ncbi:unnamed protein product [Ectocarpus sp. 12 AP-2014]
MELGSLARSLLDWPVGFEETANQFDAGSFALPTSWLVTQGVHIGLYGFFYRTAGGQGGRGGGGGEEDDVVDVRLAASLFLLAYALLCSALATRVIGGTVAASAVAVGGGGRNAGGTGGGGSLTRSNSGGSTDSRSDLVIRAISSYGVTAAQASDAAAAASAEAAGDVEALSSTPSCGGGRNTSYREGGGDGADVDSSNSTKFGDVGGERGAEPLEAAAAAGGEDARRDSLRRGLKAYMRLTVGMMVGWAYNLWGQVEFRQEELEFRFGPALGAAAYAALSTALGVCVMVRGADKLAGSNRRKDCGRTTAAAGGAVNDSVGGALGSRPGGGYFHVERPEEDEEETRRRDAAVRSYHARRLLVVVGGVSLVVGWAWEEAFDLALEGLLGDEADAATVVAKLGLAVAATAVVLGREVRQAGRRDGGGGLHDDNGAGDGGGGLLEPLVPTGDTAVL